MSSHIPSNTKIDVYELCKNGNSIFEEFFKQIEEEGNLISNLAATIRIIEDSANLKMAPKTKFRILQGLSVKCKVFEAKSGIIRVYLFHEEKTGRVIVMGGNKDSQDQDIKKVEKIIKEYNTQKDNEK
ncbi:hypothetical protein SAMN04488018_13211 [Myroides marinus]|uniref:Addiction module toxin RelE n=1 Tax=Myroides marinus TaxID=703342 RepID=A0A1H6YEA4_9FLAO|nr:hypothetical protein SAMN04488018_13211 [Myroides marinus]